MMKPFAAISIFSALLIGLATFSSAKDAYEWQNVAASGKGCFPPDCRAGQFPMAILPVIAFDGKIYLTGNQSVWTSGDGVNWISEPKTDWGERHGMRFAFFNKKLWMLGGMRKWNEFHNDVWSSDDGKNWKQIVQKTVWSARRGHSVLVFKNKLWLLGGSESSGQADKLPTRFLNDVWSSEDGINWTLITANAPWTPRSDHTALVFKDKMWIIGGEENRDVWSSNDGKNWTLVSVQANWSERRSSGGLVFDDKIWIFGGIGFNDAWFSTDGKKWERAFSESPWSTRTAAQSIVFDDKIWLYSGKTGREDSWSGDIWTMSKKEKNND